MANSAPSCTHYAFLIGIDAYSEKPLRGCVRDVCEVKKRLDDIPKPGVQIHILTASLAKDTSTARLIEESKAWPTYGNVVNMLKQITAEAKKGDFVYIHFSGHGTVSRSPLQSSPSRPFSNPSTGDLALNLFQENGINIRYLRGFELAYMLRAMVDKKLVVTLVLDCCFSGSVMRNDVSVRYLDYDPQIDSADPPTPGQSLSPEDKIRRSAYRNASLRPNWLVDPDGYTVITACGPTEVAKEIQIDGQTRGALSYFLADTFDKFGGIGGKQQHIYQAMRTRFRETREKYRHNQNPMLYGNKSLYFFGRANLRIGPAHVPAVKKQNGSFQLEAGQAHGICKGDKFTVHMVVPTGSESQEMVSQGTSTTAEVTSVGPLTSDLKLSGTMVTSDTTILATALTRLSLQRFPIRLDLGTPYPEDWAKALNEQQSLRIYHACDKTQECRYSFTVALLDDKSYEIRNETDIRLLCLPASSTEIKENAALLLELVEHLAKFELVKSLTNNSLSNPISQFKSSFSVQLINPAGDRINPGCLHAGQYGPTCSCPECLIQVEDGTKLQLEVKNEEKERGYAFCLHLYSMDYSWKIENILGGDYEVIPPRLSNQNEEFRKGSSGIWNKTLTMTVPPAVREKGEEHCDDIVKIFLSSQPSSFSSLELPELGGLLEGNKRSKHRGTGRYSPSEDWIALSFRIRTYITGT